ncbi:hypothetical protein ES703_101098 [subsurface metagenome]
MLVESVTAPPPAGCKQIRLTKGLCTIVDADLYNELNRYYWRAVRSFSRFYAVREIRIKGGYRTIRMHRQVAKTPGDRICHHKNGNTLDNRRANLANITDYLHRKLYSWR